MKEREDAMVLRDPNEVGGDNYAFELNEMHVESKYIYAWSQVDRLDQEKMLDEWISLHKP